MATWSIKSSGGDFTSLQAANDSGSVSNGDTLSVDEAFVAQSSALTINKQLTITASGTFGVTTPTAAEATSKARCASNAPTQVTISAANVLWEKVAVCPGNNNNMTAFSVGDFNGTVIRNTMIAYTNSGAANTGFLSFAGTGGNACTVYNVGFAAVTSGSDIFARCRTSGGVIDVYQCSMLSASWYSTFFADGGGTINVYASVTVGPGGYNTGIGTAADLVTQHASPPGTNARGSVTGEFKSTSFGSEDLNLYGLNGGLLTGVTDRSGTVAGLATDLAGNARPLAASFPIDPGCITIASGPSILAYGGGGATQSSEPMTASINPPVANCLLVAMIGVSGDTINTVDFGGAALTSVAAAAQNNSGLRTYVYTLSNPATGSATLTVDVNAGFSRGWFSVFALKYASDSNAPTVDVGDGVTFTSTDSSKTKATTTAQANEGCLSIWANGGSGSAPVPDSPAVLREAGTNPPNFFQVAVSARLAVSAGSTTDGWSFNSGSAGALSVVYIKPGSGGGGGSAGTITSMLSLMGVG